MPTGQLVTPEEAVKAFENTFKRFSLKNFEFVEVLSQETNCISAEVYLDGKHIGMIENRGNGGDTLIRPVSGGPNYAELGKIIKSFTSTLPDRFGGVMWDETLFDLLVEREMMLADLKKGLSRRIMAIDHEGHLVQTRAIPKPQRDAMLQNPNLASQLNASVVLNSMKPAEAAEKVVRVCIIDNIISSHNKAVESKIAHEKKNDTPEFDGPA